MTVCIAGIHEGDYGPSLIIASDRKISMYGGYFGVEGVAKKTVTVHKEWEALYSGATSPMVPILDALRRSLTDIRKNQLRPFAHQRIS